MRSSTLAIILMHVYFLWEYDRASKLAAMGMDDVIVNVMWALWISFYI
jgi:hypothetical protein